eukprot:1134250-Pelagomonas_calceolata.AAC.6
MGPAIQQLRFLATLSLILLGSWGYSNVTCDHSTEIEQEEREGDGGALLAQALVSRQPLAVNVGTQVKKRAQCDFAGCDIGDCICSRSGCKFPLPHPEKKAMLCVYEQADSQCSGLWLLDVLAEMEMETVQGTSTSLLQQSRLHPVVKEALLDLLQEPLQQQAAIVAKRIQAGDQRQQPPERLLAQFCAQAAAVLGTTLTGGLVWVTHRG